jgi:anaerobic ribonucleoside-triphosphate reductase
MQIVKRDGRVKDFQIERIQTAIQKAYLEVYNSDLHRFTEEYIFIEPLILRDLESKDKEVFDIEEVQDIIVKALNRINKKVSKAYTRYRTERTNARESNCKTFNDIDSIFNLTSDEIRNNANKDGSKIQTLRAMIADVALNNYADTRDIPRRLIEKHGKSIYIHDKNYFSLPFFNCINVDWENMLKNGFKIVTKINPPNSLSTAVALLAQIIAHTTSNTYGGNTLADIDIGLEPYAIKSENKYKELHLKRGHTLEEAEIFAWEDLETECMNAMQSLEYEITTLITGRVEPPFLTITLGYGRSKYARLIQKCYLTRRLQGFTDGTTPVFPKLCFFLEDGLNRNPEDPNYDMFQLATKCSSLRQYPDYINVEQLIKVTGDRKSPMSCRSFLGSYIDENGNFKTNGRFNQGVCSVNLVRLAILANKDENKFYSLLQEALDDCKDILMIRHNMLKQVKAKQAPILYCEGAVSRLNPEDSIEPLLLNGYSSISIGYIGIHNTLVALYGKGLNSNDESILAKGKNIMQYMRDYCEKQKELTSIGFSLYSTPFEVGATKLCQQDISDFGIIEGVTDKGYYENSFHFPSDTSVKPLDKIRIEGMYSPIASGGAIEYVEFGNMIHNTEALEEIIRYTKDKAHYFGVNTRADKCFCCDYKGIMSPKTEGENDYVCPQCGNEDKSKMSIVIRLCGYLGSLSERPTIQGKMREMQNRYIHVGKANYND